MSGIGAALGAGSFRKDVRRYGAGSGSDTVPNGATKLVAEAWAGGEGAGDGAPFVPGPPPSGPTAGTAGPSGAFVQKTINLTPTDWGKTWNYVAGAAGGPSGGNGGNSSIVNGTDAQAINMVARAAVAFTPGTASGGDINTSGNASGAAIADSDGDAYGTGAFGGFGTGVAGQPGECKFTYT